MHRQGSRFRGCNRVLPVFPESLKEDGYLANENTTPNAYSLLLSSLTSSSSLARNAAFSLTQRSHIRISYKYISPSGRKLNVAYIITETFALIDVFSCLNMTLSSSFNAYQCSLVAITSLKT